VTQPAIEHPVAASDLAARLAAVKVALLETGRVHATPFYVMSATHLAARSEELRAAFPEPWIRQYSVKANDVPGVIQRLWQLGWGANVVSMGEWRLATAAGVPNSAISLEGVGKSDSELVAVARALRDGDPIRWVALESADEVEALGLTCRAVIGGGAAPDVLLRINPEVVPETHAGLAVGRATSKFGMAEDELLASAARPEFADGTLRLRGVHVHVGSQLAGASAWIDGGMAAVDMLARLRALPGGEHADTVDFGGGFPAHGTDGPTPGEFARGLVERLEAAGATLPRRRAIEPGRRLVADAGWVVARVLQVRHRSGRQQVVLDAGMTELMRPALYGAHHGVLALSVSGDPAVLLDTDVEGPVCESADSFGRHRLPRLRRGDLVAIAHAGAYASSLSSRYNGRGRPAEFLVEEGGSVRLIRSAVVVE
jgi:diaminopimelate decarboxylase